MKLHVPLVRQSKNSSDCGLAGVVMLMRYHGRKNTSIENLRQFLQVDAGGTYGPQLGRFLLSQGFSVRIITHHPGLFTNRDRQKNQSAILDHIRGLLRKEKGAQNKKTLRHFRDFLKAGGTLS